jgi:hypothetical protein
MGAVALLGFTQGEGSDIQAALGARGLTGETVADAGALAAQHDSRMALVGVHDADGLQVLKALLTDSPQHSYGCGVPAGERKLSFSAALTGTPLFFLPPQKDEIKRVLSLMKERAGTAEAERSVFAGLRGLTERFAWKTSEVRVSASCRHFARLMRHAGYYATDAEEAEAALALEESLVNSMEHGNLELSSSLRSSETLGEDRYEQMRAERLMDPRYGGREVRISVEIEPGQAMVSIEDQGPGFDVARARAAAAEQSREKIMDASGKGLALIRRSFSEVRYNERGNVISLVKRR